MTNKEIARKFKLLGLLMELHGENPFKVKATDSAARKISKLPFPIANQPIAQLATIPGIGKSTAAKIDELVTTKTLKELDNLLEITPPGVLSIMNVKGIGAKKASAFWKELEIDTLGALWYACKDNKISLLKGFGQKTQLEIQNLVEFTIANEGKFRFADGVKIAKEVLLELNNINPKPTHISLTGPFRRKMEVLDSIDFLISKSKVELSAFLHSNADFTNVKEIETAVEGLYKNHFLVKLYASEDENFYSRLIETTGSEDHVRQLKELLKSAIPSLNSEEAIYENAGLALIPAVRREGLNEIAQAKKRELPKLIEAKDLKGSLHNHSTWSDGVHSIEEMALYCRNALKLEYFGISDHSKTAVYAEGLKIEEVYQQWEEIDKLNQKLAPFRIFKGIESDILANGSLDYPNEILAEFDFVVASIHSQLGMDEKKATNRLIKAIENPYTTILGHPTARQLLIRSGYEIDHRKVIDACAANNVVIEINSNPLRLDIDWRWIPYCLEKGVMLSINPDAHSLPELHYTDFGVIMGQKGGLTAENCLNCLSLTEIEQYFKNRKLTIISNFGND
jgi:DNA polymerase (family 10)